MNCVIDSYMLFGVYTVLPLPILYGVLHSQGVVVGGRILRISRAIVEHYYGRCKRGKAIQG